MGNTLNLGTDNIKVLLIKLAIPAIAAQLINALYNIVDRIFIAMIPETGEMALTGVGISFPIIMLITAFTGLIGYGGAPRMAIKMGEQRDDVAEKILGNALAMLLITSALLTTVFLVFGEPLLMLFGASEATLPFALDYLNIYLLGTVFVMLSVGLNPFISSQGFPKTAMGTVLIGGVLNIILDPIFIFVLDYGVSGAAFATIVSQGTAATWAVLFLTSKRTKIKIKLSTIRINKSIALPILALGCAPFIMMSTESLVMVVLNSSLQRYGGDSAVAVMTVLTAILQFMTMPIQGFTSSGQPIMSYNFGAGNIDRVKKTFKYIAIGATTYTTTLFLLLMFTPETFISIFLEDEKLMEMSVWAMRIFMGGIALLGMQFSCQQTFVSLGQAKTALLLAMTRKIFLLIPLALILPVFLEDNVFAVFLSEPIADITASIITMSIFFTTINKILNKRVESLGRNK